MEWMLMPFKRYADFSGRSQRKEYWMFALMNLIIGGVLYVIVLSTSRVPDAIRVGAMSPLSIYSIFLSGFGILLLIWFLIVLIPGLAVTVRRLHDRDLRGWWYLAFVVLSLIPIVGFLVSIAFIVVMALDGTPGPNRFGPDPKGRGGAEVFS